jgi:Mitochondrial carrier protein
LVVAKNAASTMLLKTNAAEVKNGPVQIFVRTVLDARRHLVAAAVARSTSIFAMYPVDTIKTRIQMDQANPFRLQGIYKGVDGSLLGQVPYG